MTNTPNETMKVESGVRFPNAAPGGVEVAVSATFLESGNQLQQVFIGLQPVLVVQPEYDADANAVDLVTIAVDLDPAGLVETLEVLLDAAKTMAAQQAEAEETIRARALELQAVGPDEYPFGFYLALAADQIASEA